MPYFVSYILSMFFHLLSLSSSIKAEQILKSHLVQHESFALLNHYNGIVISFPGPLFSPPRPTKNRFAFKCICYLVNKNNCFTTVFEETFPKHLYKRIDL